MTRELDPEPYVLPDTGLRKSVIGAIGAAMRRGALYDFDPRPGYSQSIEDYS